LEEETITTFTILTTDAHSNHKWLHPRQPIMLWNTQIALEWLFNPTSDTVQKLRYIPINGCKEQPSIWDNQLSVYPVSKKVNDSKYQGDDCTVEIKLEKVKSITSFFSPGANKRVKTEEEKKKKKACNKDEHDATPSSQIDDQKVEETKKESVSKDTPPYPNTKSWACTVRTFMHTVQKFDYLACEVCGSLRVEDTDSKTENDERGRKRKAI